MKVSNQGDESREYTCIIDYFVHGVEAREESTLVGPCQLVWNAWQTIFRADDTMFGGIETKLHNLRKSAGIRFTVT